MVRAHARAGRIPVHPVGRSDVIDLTVHDDTAVSGRLSLRFNMIVRTRRGT